jgi:hypothetical protein
MIIRFNRKTLLRYTLFI